MTTDTIREDKDEFWMGFRAGYQQGRSDLIEAMEAVTYDTNGRPLYRLPEDTQK